MTVPNLNINSIKHYIFFFFYKIGYFAPYSVKTTRPVISCLSLQALFVAVVENWTMSSSISALKSCNVAVIGAGPGGLVAARELRREGHKAVVFERQAQVGGTWEYQPSVEADPLASDPSRTIVHSSLYPSLRTNLPREVMGFRDYPFLSPGLAHRDSRRFPGHREVLHYINDFTTEFGVTDLIRFEVEPWRWFIQGWVRMGSGGWDPEGEMMRKSTRFLMLWLSAMGITLSPVSPKFTVILPFHYLIFILITT